MISDGMLFDTSPIEDEVSKKKKAKKPKSQTQSPDSERPQQLPRRVEKEVLPGYIMSLDDVPCEQCGAPADLVEIKRVDGREKWVVVCGWWCLHSWVIDEIPGLLDKEEPKDSGFVLREGIHSGKTFDEIAAEHGDRYIFELARLSKRRSVAKAAAEWLARKRS